jgi:hypothetical protein
MESFRHIENMVRSFLESSPGLFDGPDAGTCLRAAHEAWGGPGSIEDFETCLRRYGFVTREVGPGVYRLALLSAPISPYACR